MDNNIEFFLGKEYDESFFNSADLLQRELNQKGILVFSDFINKTGLKKMTLEAEQLKDQSYASTSEYNVYVQPSDPRFGENSARNRIMKTTKKCIPNDLIASDSPLIKVYNDPKIKAFFATLFGVPKLYPYADLLSSVNINYYDPGDALGWHFDNSDFTITLLIKNCIEGGDYQYFTDMRYNKDGSENYALVESILDQKLKPETQSTKAGDLMVFRGNKSLHQVTKVCNGERVLVTFNYNTQKGIPLSEASRRTFFGRIA
ncbi:MAG: hypothetical protein VW080_06380 [Flavobacteriaceae bacterium]